MKKGLLILAILFLGGAVAAIAMEQAGDGMGHSYCWRYKVTVDIDTPEGVKSGSAVRETCLTPFKGFNPEIADFKEEFQGEAVVVDLGKRGLIFAAAGSDRSVWYVQNVFKGPEVFTQQGIEYYSRLPVGTKGMLDPVRHPGYPTFVTFANLNDPASIRIVADWAFKAPPYPATFYPTIDEMEAVFGKGVEIKQITLEITDEPITWDIDKLLPWLDDYYDKMLDGSRYNSTGVENPVANRFGAGSFSSKGPKK